MDETFMQMFEGVVRDFRSGGVVIQPPAQFLESTNKIPGVRAEYHVGPLKIQFHFWKDPDFPQNLEAGIRSALRAFPSDSVVVEYVPEVDSWYTHVNDPPLGTSPELAEQLIKKISGALQDG